MQVAAADGAAQVAAARAAADEEAAAAMAHALAQHDARESDLGGRLQDAGRHGAALAQLWR